MFSFYCRKHQSTANKIMDLFIKKLKDCFLNLPAYQGKTIAFQPFDKEENFKTQLANLLMNKLPKHYNMYQSLSPDKKNEVRLEVATNLMNYLIENKKLSYARLSSSEITWSEEFYQDLTGCKYYVIKVPAISDEVFENCCTPFKEASPELLEVEEETNVNIELSSF